MNKKNIYLLGATGSIGKQTLEVIKNHIEMFNLVTISIGKNINKGIEIIKEFKPKFVSVKDYENKIKLENLFPDLKVGVGREGLIEAATFESNNTNKNIVVTAVVGSVGLEPTLEAIKKGYDIALANKETLVTAGHIVMDLAIKHGVSILPVDSEHSAIFQCLNGEDTKEISELIITASGGSFRDQTREELKSVTIHDALNHPNWSMGQKITIDSATMMNKGLEVIEAHWLFSMPYDKITTVLHRESIIHSMIEFQDSSIIAQLGTPDMKVPIQYALTYPNREKSITSKRLKIHEVGTLHFKPMDFNRYPCLKYANDAGRIGGSMPTVLNASNEAAVSLFLNEKITFLDIEKLIYEALNKHQVIKNPDLDTVLEIDRHIKKNILTKFNA